MEPDYPSLVFTEIYLVSRGVRPAAIIGSVEDNPHLVDLCMEKVTKKIESGLGTCELVPIPFAIKNLGHTDKVTIGVAAYPWVVQTLEWLALKSEEDAGVIFAYLQGLMLGYSPRSIEAFRQNHYPDQQETRWA